MKEIENRPLSITVEILPKAQIAVPSIDWLQFNFTGKYQDNAKYEDRLLPYGTRHFKNIIEVYQKKWKKATIANTPLSQIIHEDTNLIKLENRELYYFEPVRRLITLGTEHNLHYHNCSRIDIAIDFNTFANDLNPEEVIKRFFSCKYLKKGMSNFIIQGKQQKEQMLHYLKFTSKKATISSYLYNKSKELRDCKRKPYIIKHWTNNGLNIALDVWRLEFSIHSTKFNITDLETGETERFNPLYMDNKIYLNYVLSALITKHWDFRINDGKSKIGRMKKVKFFDNFNYNLDMKFIFEGEDSNRSDIIFINKLKDLNNEVRAQNKHIEDCTKSTITYFAETRNLKKGNYGKFTNKI